MRYRTEAGRKLRGMRLQPRIVLYCAGVLALHGCAGTIDQDDALTVVPYRVESYGRIVVEARVNEQGPHSFALDTGSSISIVFEELRDKLQLDSESEDWVNIQGAVASGRFRLLTIPRLQVGSEVWADARVAAMPGDTAAGESIDGILGIDFLSRYSMGFSVADRVVRLYAPSLLRARDYRSWAVVPLLPVSIGKGDATLFFFVIRIGGKDVLALLDLGASLNIINESAARALGLEPVRTETREHLSGAVASTTILARVTASVVRTAGVRWRNEELSIADAEIFDVLPQGDRPLAILGSGFLSQRDFIIDFERNRLLINVAKDEVDNPNSDAGLNQ